MENKRIVAEDEPILVLIDELSTDNDSDDASISKTAFKDIRDGNYVHPYINTGDDGLKLRDHARQTQGEWKRAELSAKRMGKDLHKVFKPVVYELNNKFPTLGE